LTELHACLLDDGVVRGKWTAGDQVEVDKLVNMAIDHIDHLMGMDLNDLPWPAELFGRAYITRFDPVADWDSRTNELRFFNPDFDTNDPSAKAFHYDLSKAEPAPPLPEMQFGRPVPLNYHITTAHLPALLLFKQGWCLRVGSYSHDDIERANQFGYRFEGMTHIYPDRILGYKD
jgi:hypothetical protein